MVERAVWIDWRRELLLQTALERPDPRFVIGVFGDFLDLLGVDDFAVLVEDENAAGQQFEFFDQFDEQIGGGLWCDF